MSTYVFPPTPVASVPVRGSEQRYPVQRIFCVGRNYAAHVREMGADPDREPPIYFCKNPVHLHLANGQMNYPQGTADLHYEMELVVALGQPVANATADQVAGAIWGYACGLDMTRRDLQAVARKGGMPWDLAKDFEQSAVIGELVPVGTTGQIDAGRIALSVNGQVRQQSDLNAMIWSVPDIIANLSHYYHLQPGDLIYTGTPEGVGAVAVGDKVVGEIEGVGTITLGIAPAA